LKRVEESISLLLCWSSRSTTLTSLNYYNPPQERLQGIGINTFEQIAAMTGSIEGNVNEAIEYFPGRVKRDEWALQAREFAAKKAKKATRGKKRRA